MKKFTKLVLLLLLIVATVCVFTACDNESNTDNVVGEISVEQSGMPQLVFVRGEQLDLSNGVLTVKNGDAVEEVSMTAEGVTVTGYDANKLGEQTITITYGGKSTELKITVVERMQVVGHVTDYLVGDKLDTATGRLQITRNDGSNYTMLLGSTGVEIVGYDANKTGNQTLTVKYSANDVTYECKFDINVFAVENIEFFAPTKISYNSHEAGLDLTNGYFTLTGNGGKLTKNVPLEEGMISNFDLSAVNADNSPLTQTLTVTYNGKAYNYDVTLTYSTISMFQKEAGAFNVFNWNGDEIPEISEELGEKALELMKAYLDLSKAEQNYISHEDTMNVARTALLYGIDCIDPELIALEGAFTIEGGGLAFTCETREDVELAVEILDNEDGEIYRISPILAGLIEEFEDEEIYGGMYFGELAFLSAEDYEFLLDMFQHMLDVHDVLMEIPDDWQTVGVQTYATEIEAFYDEIFSNSYVEVGMAEIYGYVSNWRSTGDAFDILYQYYYENNNREALNSLAAVNLPSCLSEIAYHIIEMMTQAEMIGQGGVWDTTQLMYHYHTAIRMVEELKASDDEMAKNLYNILPVNAMMGWDNSTLFDFDTLLLYTKSMQYGYYYHSGGLLGIQAYEDLMNAYMDMVTKIIEDDTYDYSDRYNADIEAIFDMFIELTPTQQYYFLGSLNAYYAMSAPPMVFDDSTELAEGICLLARRLNEYYRSNLGDVSGAYDDLIIAIEIYAQRVSREFWVAEFTERMQAVDAAYEAMSAEEKAAFDRYLGKAYGKYSDIRDRFVNTTEYTDMGEWAEKFAELDKALENAQIAGYYIEQKGVPMYSMFLSAYERAQILVADIMENAPQHVRDAFNFEMRYGLDENGEVPEGVVLSSYEYAMANYRTMYINYLLGGLQQGSIYEGYIVSALPEFLNMSYDLNWVHIHNTENDPAAYDKAKVLAVLKAFREMSHDEQVTFILLEGDNSAYYSAIEEFLNGYYTEAVVELAMKLMDMEMANILYNYDPSEESLASLTALYEEVTAMYAALSAEDLANFADLEDLYNFYVDAYEAIVADQENAA